MIKRIFDLDAATFGLLLILPISFGTAALIRVKFGSSVLFSQIRLGLNGMPFRAVKFLSMSDARNSISWEQKFACDRVRGKSKVLAYAKMLWLAIRKVFVREGIMAKARWLCRASGSGGTNSA